jgi:hypothetical protein
MRQQTAALLDFGPVSYLELLRSEREAAQRAAKFKLEPETTGAVTREAPDVKPEAKQTRPVPKNTDRLADRTCFHGRSTRRPLQVQKKQGGFEPPCWVGQVSQTLNHTVSLCACFHHRARS